MLVYAVTGAEAQTRFLAEADDIPLPDALTEAADRGATFTSSDGRLIEAHASGATSASDVRAFYVAAMPTLGWSQPPGDPLVFRRGRERLTIGITEQGALVDVNFRIVASAASLALD